MARKNRATLILDGQDQTGPTFDSVESRLRAATASFGSFKTVLTGIAAYLSTQWAQRVIEAGDNIKKLSEEINISTQALKEYEFVAASANLSIEQLTAVLRKQQIRVSEAAEGTGAAVDALKELGLQADKLEKLTVDQQFELIAEQLSNVQNQGDRARIAMKLWEEGGVQFLRVVNQGAEGIANMRDRARELGANLGPEQAQKLANLAQATTDFQVAINNAANEIIVTVAGPLTDFFNWMAVKIPEGIQAATTALEGFQNWLSGMLKADADTIGRLNYLLIELAANLDNDTARAAVAALHGELSQLAEKLDGAANKVAPAVEKLKELKGDSGQQGLFTQEQIDAIDQYADSHIALYEQIQSTITIDKEAADAHILLWQSRRDAMQEFYQVYREMETQQVEWLTEKNDEAIEIMEKRKAAMITNTQSMFGALASLAATMGAKAFKAYQIFAGAEALAAAYVGATKAAAAAAEAGPAATTAAYVAVFARLAASALAIANINPGSAVTTVSTGGGGGYTPGGPPGGGYPSTDVGTSTRTTFIVLQGGRTISDFGPGDVDQLFDLLQEGFNTQGRTVFFHDSPQAHEVMRNITQGV